MSIIISQNGSNAQKIDRSDIEKEDYLQNYIHNNPDAIPIYELKEDKKLLVLKREFSTNAGPIDALAIDKDGDIYIVETKLYKNPDKRTVVAQALDYGAALWKHFNDFSKFIQILNQEIESKFKISLEDKIKEFFNLDDEGLNFVLERLKDNLNDGNLKFVILMDSIGERLKDLILYVNQNSQFDIYAVQLEYYKFEQYEIMIPKMFGVEVKKSLSNGSANSARRKWDEQSFFEEIKKAFSGIELEAIIKLYDFSKKSADEIHWGTGVNNGSFSVRFYKLGNRPLFVIHSDGKLRISTEYPKREASPEQVANLDRLNSALKDIGMNVNPVSERTVFTIFGQWTDKVDRLIEKIKEVIL